MNWFQKEIVIQKKSRGFHLITDEIYNCCNELNSYKKGIINIFIKHTSASLTINENADRTVRQDFEQHFNNMVPENQPYYRHTDEGPDDMPAHIKSSILGSSIQIPITNGKFNLGIWQGIYLCEHRDYGNSRKLVLTVWGQI